MRGLRSKTRPGPSEDGYEQQAAAEAVAAGPVFAEVVEVSELLEAH